MPLWTTPKRVMNWYKAAAKWDEILRRNDSEYRFQLKPGRVLIFDNHRVLHGRSAFTGLRRMCGGYSKLSDLAPPPFRHTITITLGFPEDPKKWGLIHSVLVVNMDDFMSRWRNLNLPREEVLAQVIG